MVPMLLTFPYTCGHSWPFIMYPTWIKRKTCWRQSRWIERPRRAESNVVKWFLMSKGRTCTPLATTSCAYLDALGHGLCRPVCFAFWGAGAVVERGVVHERIFVYLKKNNGICQRGSRLKRFGCRWNCRHLLRQGTTIGSPRPIGFSPPDNFFALEEVPGTYSATSSLRRTDALWRFSLNSFKLNVCGLTDLSRIHKMSSCWTAGAEHQEWICRWFFLWKKNQCDKLFVPCSTGSKFIHLTQISKNTHTQSNLLL